VACYGLATGKELWRFVYDGDGRKGRKVYPDGKEEPYAKAPPFDPETEQKRLAPARDARGRHTLLVVRNAFRMFATDTYSYSDIARYLRREGVRNSAGGHIQAGHVERMLRDPAYLGSPAWGRRSRGKYNCRKGGETVPRLNFARTEHVNDPADWERYDGEEPLWPPVVEPATFEAVQAVADARRKKRRPRAPGNCTYALQGLLRCGHCGKPMNAHRSRRRVPEYFCATNFARCAGRIDACDCLRHSIDQDEVLPYVERWAAETPEKLGLLPVPRPGPTGEDPRVEAADRHLQAFQEGFGRLMDYLARHHRAEYAAIVADKKQRRAEMEAAFGPAGEGGEDPLGPRERAARDRQLDEAIRRYWRTVKEKGNRAVVRLPDFVQACLDLYRDRFDPSGLAAEIEALKAEHDTLRQQCLKLTDQRAIDDTNKELTALSDRITDLERQQGDLAAQVAADYLEHEALCLDLADVAAELRKPQRDDRVLAERLRRRIEYIDVFFEPTGDTRPGRPQSVPKEIVVQGRDGAGPAHYTLPTGRRG
jgi:hypothetical protein